MATVAKSTNAALPSLKRPTEGVERVEEGAVVLLLGGIRSIRGDEGARARGSPRRQWRSVSPPERGESEREREQGASEGQCGVVAPLKPSRPDWWAPSRRTVTTTHPCIGAGLWPVGHTDGSEL
jgi:hypothetical protein